MVRGAAGSEVRADFVFAQVWGLAAGWLRLALHGAVSVDRLANEGPCESSEGLVRVWVVRLKAGSEWFWFGWVSAWLAEECWCTGWRSALHLTLGAAVVVESGP